ncbi:MAG: hypothetical protein R6U65_04590 [Perlabentimonas sp.]
MKKIFLLPMLLLGALAVITWSCEPEEEEEDLCYAFEDILAINPTCDVPTACCPLDGGDCYYVNPDGPDYYCDADLDSDENPDGCNDAMNDYIDNHCETAKMSGTQREKIIIELRMFTQDLMAKAKARSVCL